MRLFYVDNFDKGFTRRRVRNGWRYLDLNGRPVRSQKTIARLNGIGLPPAYQDAWFCPRADGHIQAIGIDAKGRRQYRYHPDFSAQKDADKYQRCLAFAKQLPAIRKQIAHDIRRRDLCYDRVVGAVIRLLDVSKIRVGNRQYAKANKSFGATTLRNRHASVRADKISLEYTGKSGKQQRISIRDRRLSTIVKRCQDAPGQMLFQYFDNDGNAHPVTSSDVNDYLKEHAGDFTAKDFRTWGASVIAYSALVRSKGEIGLKAMLAEVSEQLGNTPAIARKSYVHPALISAAHSDGIKPDFNALPRATKYLTATERGLMTFLASL